MNWGGRNIPFHIVAIKRGNEKIIPRGDDVIKLHDIVYFTTTKKYIPDIRKITGKRKLSRCTQCDDYGRQPHSCSHLHNMYRITCRSRLLKMTSNRCNRLTEVVDDKVMIINGDGRDMDLLMEEGLKTRKHLSL